MQSLLILVKGFRTMEATDQTLDMDCFTDIIITDIAGSGKNLLVCQ
ncbi:hypothetical protein Ahos_0225 [Acidianus hospitalis W1]|uniref:Uncharacterized protein n=1 Tax=Acidianus hospitalis (strain W1) TaxID=933801 RepID=F4B4V2_ACIHW|nr:hypothetical protein Ahos_0225 [Acidianus hospitalis W1]